MKSTTITEITCDLERDDQLAIREELMNLASDAPAVAESTSGDPVAITDGYREMTAGEAIRAMVSELSHEPA